MKERMVLLRDTELEMWLRERNDGKIYTHDKDGNHIPLKDLTDEELAALHNKLYIQQAYLYYDD